MKHMKGLSSRQIGKILGKSHVAVDKAAKTGRIPRNEDGSYELDAVREAWDANTDPNKGKGPRRKDAPPEPDMTPPAGEKVHPGTLRGLQLSRAMSAFYTAQKDKAEFERVSGSQVPTKEVERIAFQSYRLVRDRLLVIPDRVGPVLAGVTDIQTCAKIVNDEIVMVLEELSEGIFPR